MAQSEGWRPPRPPGSPPAVLEPTLRTSGDLSGCNRAPVLSMLLLNLPQPPLQERHKLSPCTEQIPPILTHGIGESRFIRPAMNR